MKVLPCIDPNLSIPLVVLRSLAGVPYSAFLNRGAEQEASLRLVHVSYGPQDPDLLTLAEGSDSRIEAKRVVEGSAGIWRSR